MSRVKNAGRVILGSDQSDSIYLARIAELEAEIQALTLELERYKASALSGAITGLPTDPGSGIGDLGGRQSAPPIHVNADGTQGMRRGVSGRRTRSPRDVDEQLE